MFERGLAQDPWAQSSLCGDEPCFCVKNRRASYGLVMTLIATIARVVPNGTNRVLVACDGP